MLNQYDGVTTHLCHMMVGIGGGGMGKNRATRVRGIDNFTLTYGSQLYVSPPPVMS